MLKSLIAFLFALPLAAQQLPSGTTIATPPCGSDTTLVTRAYVSNCVPTGNLPSGSGVLKVVSGAGALASPSTGSGTGDYQVPLTEMLPEDFTNLVGTSACTISSVVYHTPLTCAVATANAIEAATGIAPMIRLGWTTYYTDIQLQLSCYGNYSFQCVGIKGQAMWGSTIAPLNSSVHVAGPAIKVAGTSPNTSSITLTDFNLALNYQFAGCWDLDGVTLNQNANVVCNKAGNQSGYQTGNGGSGSTANTDHAFGYGVNSGAGDFRVDNIFYNSGAAHGQGFVAQAVLSGTNIQSWTILQSVSSYNIISAGNSGTNNVYTITATGGNCVVEPIAKITVAGGSVTVATSTTSTANGYPSVGLCQPGSTPTISLSSIPGLTGASVTLTMANTGDNNYNSGYNWTAYYTGPNRPGGTTPCATPPTNAPVLTYSGGTSGSITAAGLQDGTVASTGTGCIGPVYMRLATGDPINYAFKVNVPDSKFDYIRSAGGGQIAGLYAAGASTYWHPHMFGTPGGIYDAGGNNEYFGIETDSPLSYGFFDGNGTKVSIGETIQWNSSDPYPGAVNVIFGSGASTQQQFIAGSCGDLPYDITDFVNKVTATGPGFGAGAFGAYYNIADATCSSETDQAKQYFIGPPVTFGAPNTVQGLPTGFTQFPYRVYDSGVVTGQTASLAATTIYTPTTAGEYRINIQGWPTTAATAGTLQCGTNFNSGSGTISVGGTTVTITSLGVSSLFNQSPWVPAGDPIQAYCTLGSTTGSPVYSYKFTIWREQ